MIILELLIKVKCLIKRLILIKDYSSKNIFCMRLLVEYKMKTIVFICAFTQCWETLVGQEIYRLVLMDLLFSVSYIILAEFLWG